MENFFTYYNTFTHAIHKTTIFIIQLYFINELLHLEVDKMSTPGNATTNLRCEN